MTALAFFIGGLLLGGLFGAVGMALAVIAGKAAPFPTPTPKEHDA